MKLKKHINLILILIMSAIILCSCSFDISFYDEENRANPSGNLIVHYLDVGQGDSIFIELPNAQSMLIDAADRNYGEGIVDYIEDCGYSQIDYLIATHPHADHIGSMSYVVDNMNIGSVYMPKVSTNTKTYEKLLTSISDKGLKIKTATAGLSIIDEGNLTADVVAPIEIDSDNLNNCSIVLKLTYKDKSFLFTGDAEHEELKQITADITADVLKVGHHGSGTSTNKDFLEQVNPSISVISVGKNNDYGHPHKSAMTALKKSGCELYRTDKDKTVVVTSEGSTLTVETNHKSIERDD